MAISRNDVKKALFAGETGQSSCGSSKMKVNPTVAQTAQKGMGRETRHTRASVQPKGVVNLAKMTSGEFDDMIGEGPSPLAVSTNTKLKNSKKMEEMLKVKNLVNLNVHVLNADGISVDSKDEEEMTDAISVNDQNLVEPNSPKKSGEQRSEPDKIKMSLVSETNKHDSSNLDRTLPLFGDKEVQTESCYILCTCNKCKDLLKKFSVYITRGYGEDCDGEKPNDGGKGNNSQLSLSFSAQNIRDDEKVALFKGSNVTISITAKAKLKCLDRDRNASPKDYVYVVMDDLYDSQTMSNMTASGRTQGSTMMDTKVKDGLFVYLSNKFEDVDMKDITDHVNSKCYCERRKLWGKKDAVVRKRFQKNSRKAQHEILNDGEDSNHSRSTKRQLGKIQNEKRSKHDRRREEDGGGRSEHRGHARKKDSGERRDEARCEKRVSDKVWNERRDRDECKMKKVKETSKGIYEEKIGKQSSSKSGVEKAKSTPQKNNFVVTLASKSSNRFGQSGSRKSHRSPLKVFESRKNIASSPWFKRPQTGGKCPRSFQVVGHSSEGSDSDNYEQVKRRRISTDDDEDYLDGELKGCSTPYTEPRLQQSNSDNE